MMTGVSSSLTMISAEPHGVVYKIKAANTTDLMADPVNKITQVKRVGRV